MDPGLIENSVPCFDVCLFLVLFSSVVVSEFCSLLSCVVFTGRLVLYMDANSSTYRVNRGENFFQCLSWQQTTALGAVSIVSHQQFQWMDMEQLARMQVRSCPQSSVPRVQQAALGAVGSRLSHIVCWLGWLDQMPAASSSSPYPGKKEACRQTVLCCTAGDSF